MSYYTSFQESSLYTSQVDGRDVVYTASWITHTVVDADPMVTLAKDGSVPRTTISNATIPNTSHDSSPVQTAAMTSGQRSPTSLPSSPGTHLNGGQVAGIVIGSLVFLIVCVFSLVTCWRSKKRKHPRQHKMSSGRSRSTITGRESASPSVDREDMSSQDVARTSNSFSTFPDGLFSNTGSINHG